MSKLSSLQDLQAMMSQPPAASSPPMGQLSSLQDLQAMMSQPSAQKADSWLDLIGKSAVKGVTSLADIPQTIGSFVAESANPEHGLIGKFRQARDLWNGEEHVPLKGPRDYLPEIPLASNMINRGLEGLTGIDFTPKPTTGAQRIASHAVEFATPLGLISKGPKAINMLKNAGAGFGIGATSGALQEGGIDPLTADIATSLTLPALSATKKNLFNKFSSANREGKVREKVAKSLKQRIGEENLPNVLKNIEEYKKQSRPIPLELTTPEIAQDIGLSQLYRTQSDLPAIPARHRYNESLLREGLEGVGTTGLEESTKGDLIRQPFIDYLDTKKLERAQKTEPLYKALEKIKEGIDPAAARELLKQEINVASPNVRKPLEKYLNSLNRNDVSPVDIQKMDALKKQISQIEKEYSKSSPKAIEKYKAPFVNELRELEKNIYPYPIQIENTIQELGDKVNAFSKTGETNSARRYGNIKKAYEQDLSKSEAGLKHREEYAKLSKPINEIETSNLLNAFVAQNKDVNKLAGLAVPSEKLPQLILKANIPNTKVLLAQSKNNPELINLIKGVYIDELLGKTTLSSGNFSYDKARKFLNDKVNKEKIELIFNKDEKAKLKQFVDALERRTKMETAGKVSGSDTHQKLKIDNQFNASLGGLGKLLEKFTLKSTGTGKIGQTILEGSKNVINSIKNQRSNAVLENALLDPEYFSKLMTEKRQAKGFMDFYNPVNPLVGSYLINKGDE